MVSPRAMTAEAPSPMDTALKPEPKPKLHGRAFYESLGSPKFVVAPMVDQSEFVGGNRLWQHDRLTSWTRD